MRAKIIPVGELTKAYIGCCLFGGEPLLTHGDPGIREDGLPWGDLPADRGDLMVSHTG